MQRRKHSREFKLEAARLIKERGVSVAAIAGSRRAATLLRNWVADFGGDPTGAFPDHGQMEPERLEIALLPRETS
ncbi:MAG: transposase [Sphingomonadales bacterium]|nr:transposase [Sphingomonadales bacterium]